MLKERQPCGSLVYWATALSIVPLVAAVAAAVGTRLIRQHARRELGGYAWAQGDVHWTHRSTAHYSSVCSLAGLFAGMFGVGGGIVKGPLMLEMGVLPDVAAATRCGGLCAVAKLALPCLRMQAVPVWPMPLLAARWQRQHAPIA